MACQITTKKDTKNGQTTAKSADMRAIMSLIMLHSMLVNFAIVCLPPVRGNSSLGPTCYKVFKRRIPPQNVSAPAPPPRPSRFETRALQQGPSTQIYLTLHCFLLLTSPPSLPQQHARIPCISPTLRAHRHRVRGHRIRFPLRVHMRRFHKKWRGLYLLVWLRFLSHFPPRFTYNNNNIPPRVRIVRASCRLSSPPRLFCKVQRNEFSPKSVSALLTFVPSPRTALYP